MSFRYLCCLCDGFFVLICKQIVNFSKNTPKKGFLNAYPLRGIFSRVLLQLNDRPKVIPRQDLCLCGPQKAFAFWGEEEQRSERDFRVYTEMIDTEFVTTKRA